MHLHKITFNYTQLHLAASNSLWGFSSILIPSATISSPTCSRTRACCRPPYLLPNHIFLQGNIVARSRACRRGLCLCFQHEPWAPWGKKPATIHVPGRARRSSCVLSILAVKHCNVREFSRHIQGTRIC